MPARRPYRKSQTRERSTYAEMLLAQLRETNKRIDRLEEKIDALKDKADNNRRFLPNISTVDISYIGIALGVLYALFLK